MSEKVYCGCVRCKCGHDIKLCEKHVRIQSVATTYWLHECRECEPLEGIREEDGS